VTLVSGQGPLDVAVDGTNVYFTGAVEAGVVGRAPLEGGQSVTLVANQGGPAGLALDAVNVYWTAASDGTVMLAPK
jgi:hypothetical protein